MIKLFLKFPLFYRNFKTKNKHNKTIPKNLFKLEDVDIGIGTYGPIQVIGFGMPGEKLSIGAYCSIAKNVEFILGGNHNYSRFSTYPFGIFSGKKDAGNRESNTKGPIIIGDDVWLAYGCKILSGVTIGKGAIVSAFSVVTKDIPPYAIVGGVPAKILKYRFSPEIISLLEDLPPMSQLSVEKILQEYESILDIRSVDDVRALERFYLE